MEKMQKLSRTGTKLESAGLTLYFRTNAFITEVNEEECYHYSYDACDGRRETGRALANHVLTLEVAAGRPERWKSYMKWSRGAQNAQEIISGLRLTEKLEEKCGLKS